MTTEEQDAAIAQILTAKGIGSQLKQTSEECLELALAIRKLERTAEKHRSTDYQYKERERDLISEVADVAVMIRQCYRIFGADAINRVIDQKLERELIRMKGK